MTDLRHARLIVSADALLSVREAARLLGFRGAVEWIERHVSLRRPGGHARVRWGDVLEAAPPEGEDVAEPKRKGKPRLRLADV